ncbi:MAG: hypothetical protein METHAR1v1_700028 [Methanothrix sp.]|nr:MAG: hypothetical protein METHAR1v1_700028 [Methanothrix sp.]
MSYNSLTRSVMGPPPGTTRKEGPPPERETRRLTISLETSIRLPPILIMEKFMGEDEPCEYFSSADLKFT